MPLRGISILRLWRAPSLNNHARFKDLGEDYYNQFNREKKKNYYLKKLTKLGVNLKEATLSIQTAT